MKCQQIFETIDNLNEEYISVWTEFCNIESPTSYKEGVDKACNYIVERAKKHGIPAEVVCRKDSADLEGAFEKITALIEEYQIDYMILAGYLSIIPASFTSRYAGRIVNIHPSLIPSFCGQGYYGLNVHRAVLEYGAKVTGVTVHFVDEGADTGAIIMQRAVEVEEGDTPETLQARVLKTEHVILPEAVKLLTQGKITLRGRTVTIERE